MRSAEFICPLGPRSDRAGSCARYQAKMRPIVEGALFRVLVCRPDLFDFHDLRNGRPKVLDPGEYGAAVKAALEAQGICALSQERGLAIEIKNTNEYSEEWRIATARGYVARQYVATCIPAGW